MTTGDNQRGPVDGSKNYGGVRLSANEGMSSLVGTTPPDASTYQSTHSQVRRQLRLVVGPPPSGRGAAGPPAGPAGQAPRAGGAAGGAAGAAALAPVREEL